DHQFAVSAVNPAFTDLVRSSAEEWVGRHWSDCSHSELTTRIIQRLADQGHWEGELLEQRADGHAFPLHIGFRTVIANGQVSHYLGFCRDLSLHRPSRKALAAEHYDALTGLPERAYFHQQLDYYRRMDQLPPLQVAVGILNIDHFAHLNEQFGRPAGDTLLQDIAARLNQYGAPLIMVSRLNADEFGLLFSHFETPMRLNHLAMQIIADINRPVLTEQEEVLATASMGLVMLDQHNIHECMNIARAHLQHVQRKGGNGVVDASTAHPSPALNKDRAQQALHILLEQAERPQRFRPQLNASHQSFMAIRVSNLLEYEALGDIQVASLYTLAQEMRLEERLFKQLLSTACTCYQLCRQDGAPETTLLSFPVTATLLLNEHLRVMIDVVLRQEGLAPGQLELSFSASVLRHDHPAVLTQLNALHAAGFRLMLEDLEDWPATLLQLTALPIDTLRVKQPMPSQPMPPGSRENLPPSTALLAQFCLHFGWTLCLSRLDSNEQHQAVRSLPAALLPHSRLEGTVLSRATNAQDLATFVRHQTALLAVAQQVH
ncbi:MAG: diguanylate cyclase, partial [Natronospirillum sp.]